MLRLLTDLNQVVRQDFSVLNSGIITSSVTGTWVTHHSAGTGLLLAATDADGSPYSNAWQIWNQNNTNVAGAFSPDVTRNQQLTILQGQYRAITDQFTGTATIGDALVLSGIASAEGLVVPIPMANVSHAANHHIIGTVIGTQTNFSYLGVTAANVIEFWRL